MHHKSLTSRIGGVLGVICVAAITFGIVQFVNWYETGESKPTVPWLPDYATNVSFARTHNWQLFEFDVTEENFRDWATQYQVLEISEPFYIERFHSSSSQLIAGPESGLSDELEIDPDEVAIIRNGLMHHAWTNNRGGISLCFDRDKRRAYFHSRKR